MSKVRDRWSSKTIFICAALGSAIGLGNVWRFPYLVGKYGGGAFLIPYLLILFALGIPLLILEFALGQKMQRGAVDAFQKISPKWSGIGLAAVLSGFGVVCYYMIVMAWSLLYTCFAFDLSWGTDTKAFFYKDVLHISSSVGELGMVVPSLLVALIVSWVMVYFAIWKGVKSVGKVVAVTMPLPIVLLVILLFKGISLPGAGQGVAFFLTPDFSALMDTEVWTAAVAQIFFTLGVGFGVMIAYASYRDVKEDITKSALITALLNSTVSLLAGFAVFSTLGYMALKKGVPVSELAASGPSLAFIVFPQALMLIPGAKFFAVLFFVMLLTLAIDSAFSLVEAVGAVFSDYYEHLRKQDVVMYICVVGCIGGVIFSTQAGLYYLDIIDHFVTSYGLVVVGLLEVLVVGWGYGAEKLRNYINSVSDIRLGRWWSVMVLYVIPAILLALLGSSLYKDLQTPYEGYPSWALGCLGWGAVAAIFLASTWVSVRSVVRQESATKDAEIQNKTL